MSGGLTKCFEFFKDNWGQILAILTSVITVWKALSLLIETFKRGTAKKYYAVAVETKEEVKQMRALYQMQADEFNEYKSNVNQMIKTAVTETFKIIEKTKKNICMDILSDKEIRELEVEETTINFEPVLAQSVSKVQEVEEIAEQSQTTQETSKEQPTNEVVYV